MEVLQFTKGIGEPGWSGGGGITHAGAVFLVMQLFWGGHLHSYKHLCSQS